MRLTTVAQTVRTAIDSGQIGTPVAVRLVAWLDIPSDDVPKLLASASSLAADWLSDRATRVDATGRRDEQFTLLCEFSRGGSALISAGRCPAATPTLGLIVFGSRGMLTWEHDAGTIVATGVETPDDVRRQVHDALAAMPVAESSVTPIAVPPVDKRVKPPFGLLLVSGLHTHQPNYAQALTADGRCRIIGLTDEADVPADRRTWNEQLATDLGVPVLSDLSDALRRDDIDIVSICAEPYRRGRIMVEAANAGKHLYLDKPLAGSVEVAEQIAAAVAQASVVGHMFSLAHTDYAERIRETVESGRIGELRAIHCDLCFAKGHGDTATLGNPRQESAVPERFELRDAKRELTNVGVYCVVLMLRMLDRQAVRVSATTGNYFFAEHQHHDMEDFGQMLIEFEGGVSASVSAGRAGWRSNPSTGLNRAWLWGTEGTAVIDAQGPRVEIWADAAAWTPPPRNPDDPMAMWMTPATSPFAAAAKQSWILPPESTAGDASYFLDCIEQGRQSDVAAPLAALSTKILMSAYRSAAERKPVELADGSPPT